jgi:hypothetical protein
MTESPVARLGSAYLEDMAIIALVARPGHDDIDLHPEVGEQQRTKLRARLKQIGRYGWPASMQSDALIRQGYTLRQCYRIVIVLLLIDAQLPPSVAVPVCVNNEMAFLKAIATRLRRADTSSAPEPSDLIFVIVLGELWEQVDAQAWQDAQPLRVRMLERGRLSECWSSDAGLALPGQRLLIDAGTAAQTVWRWMRARRLMPTTALDDLLVGIDQEDSPDFVPRMEREIRK